MNPFKVLLLLFCCLLKCDTLFGAINFNSTELTPGPLRFTNGRPNGGNDELARFADKHPDQYWSTVIGIIEGYMKEKSEKTFQQWNLSVAQNEQLKARISSQCFSVLEYMIQNPMKQEWIAKSTYLPLLAFFNAFILTLFYFQ